MEATGLRTVIMGLLVLGVVVTEMEAKACKTNFCYISCRARGAIPVFCAGKCGCSRSLASGLVEITGSISEYCTLGCSSSLCDRMAVGLKTGAVDAAGEGEVKQAMQHCNNACYELCNKAAA